MSKKDNKEKNNKKLAACVSEGFTFSPPQAQSVQAVKGKKGCEDYTHSPFLGLTGGKT